MESNSLSLNVRGGVEKFCKTLYNELNVHPVFYDKSIFSLSQKEQKQSQLKFIQEIISQNPDIVIMNGYRGNKSFFNNSAIQNLNIPVMHIDHYFVHFPGHSYKLEKLHRARHSIFTVSPGHKHFIENECKRMDNKNISLDGYIFPEYAHKTSVVEAEYDFSTIGRMCPDKNPLLLAKYCFNTNYSYKIFSNMEFPNYFEKNKKYLNEKFLNLDLNHDDIIQEMKKSSVFFSTWDKETFGITALEALSSGVPVILNTNKKLHHASECIPSSPNYIRKIMKGDKNNFFESFNDLKHINRFEIAESTQEKHSLQNWKRMISNAIDYTIEKFNKKSLLEL